jgi:hypothetical protein
MVIRRNSPTQNHWRSSGGLRASWRPTRSSPPTGPHRHAMSDHVPRTPSPAHCLGSIPRWHRSIGQRQPDGNHLGIRVSLRAGCIVTPHATRLTNEACSKTWSSLRARPSFSASHLLVPVDFLLGPPLFHSWLGQLLDSYSAPSAITNFLLSKALLLRGRCQSCFDIS